MADGTITLQPDGAAGKDSQIFIAAPDTNYGTNTTSIIGKGGAGNQYRFLLQFTTSGIPEDATVDSAILTLQMDADLDSSGAETHNIHRLITVSWVETQVTWNSRSAGNAWGTAGGDYDPVADASTSVNGVGAYNFTITNLVQEWADGTDNRGMLLKDSNEGVSERKRYTTSDHATAETRPKLVIIYTEAAPPTPGEAIMTTKTKFWGN